MAKGKPIENGRKVLLYLDEISCNILEQQDNKSEFVRYAIRLAAMEALPA